MKKRKKELFPFLHHRVYVTEWNIWGFLFRKRANWQLAKIQALFHEKLLRKLLKEKHRYIFGTLSLRSCLGMLFILI